jgi:hypothetical protein
MFNGKEQGADEFSQYQSSPCGRSTPPVRHPPIRPLDEYQSANQPETIRLDKGELKESLQAWSSHMASTRSPILLLPVRFYRSLVFPESLERKNIEGQMI